MNTRTIGKSTFKSNLLLLLIIVLLALNALIVIFAGGGSLQAESNDLAVFDLSGVSFDSGEHVYLRGNWEFFYNSLIETDDNVPAKVSTYMSVPSSWNSVFNSENEYLSGGYASYRCTIANVSAEEPLTVYVPNIACAYNVYVNGSLVSSSGDVTKEKKVWTEASHESIPFTLSAGNDYEIVIEVAAENYSGLYMTPVVSNYRSDLSYTGTMTALRFALCGMVFSCGFIFFILRHFVNKSLYSIWLPVLSFVLFLRMIITAEGYAFTQPMFFNLSYEQMTLFIFASTFIIKLVALIYMMKCIGISVQENTVVYFCAIFLALAVGTNFLPNSVFDIYYFVILQLLSTILDIYIINKLCIEIINKTPYSLLYLMSYLFMVSGVTVDSLYINGLVPYRCSSYMPICFFLFVLFTTIIHALRIKKMYSYALETQTLEKELENANMSIMLSQIQPHFLYNALNTIKALIRRDPPKAEKAIIDFSLYLRGNMDSLSKTDPIPFSEELDHIKYYCNIEQMRFPDKLEIYFDIGPDKFYVPTLSVQPIVENAIKHGVTKKAEGGSVTIETKEDEKNYYIIVEDDGVGFNVETVWDNIDKSRSHVGIENITDRLESMMGAAVSIDSEVGRGTKITIKLPKNRNVKTIQESLELNNNKNLFKEMEI